MKITKIKVKACYNKMNWMLNNFIMMQESKLIKILMFICKISSILINIQHHLSLINFSIFLHFRMNFHLIIQHQDYSQLKTHLLEIIQPPNNSNNFIKKSIKMTELRQYLLISIIFNNQIKLQHFKLKMPLI